MVNVSLRSRHDIKKYLNELLDLISSSDYMESCNLVDDLSGAVYKYYTTRTQPYEDKLDALVELKFELEHGGLFPVLKKERVRKSVDKFIELLSEVGRKGSLQERLIEMSESIDDDFYVLTTSGLRDDIRILYDDFASLQKLSKAFAKERPHLHATKFLQMMKNADAFKSLLPLIPLRDTESKGVWSLSPDIATKLKPGFAAFHSSIADVITSLDISEKEEAKHPKKTEQESIIDIDEVEKAAIRKEGLEKLKKGWTVENTARHYDLEVDDFLTIMGFEISEEQDEQKEEEK